MDNQEILYTDELRARIMELEYSQLTVDKIKKIYYEETGKELNLDINIFHSKDYEEELDIGKNGFDGTIIHFYDKNKGINEVYSITRGSEAVEENTNRPDDWMYNLFGIFIGQNTEQYHDAQKFDEFIISNYIKNNKEDFTYIGFGHSLGGNTKQLQQILLNDYDRVYIINDAPPTFYQLAKIDLQFRRQLSIHFNLEFNNFNQIYTIDPIELKKFTEEYYKEAGQNIYHLVAEEDLLQMVSQTTRGFVHIGNYQVVDTIPGTNRLLEFLNRIPDKDIQAIQIYLSKYADVYNTEGFDGALKALTGIDAKLIDRYKDFDLFSKDILEVPDLAVNTIKMISDITKKLPDFIEALGYLIKNIDSILNAALETDLISLDEKQAIMNELQGMKEDFKQSLNKIFRQLNPITLFKEVRGLYKNILKRMEIIKQNLEPLIKTLNNSVNAHSIHYVLNGLENNKTYKANGDVVYHFTKNGQTIHVNVSSAYRIFTEGYQIYEKKQKILTQLKQDFEREYIDDYNERKRILLSKIEDMESYPSKYQHLLGNFTYDSQYYYLIKSIHVHEVIPPLESSNFISTFEHMFYVYEKEIEKGITMIDKFKKKIEEFFEQEEELARRY